MAMLAEPRRKQRIGTNPRGKQFLEQEQNFGRSMLEKLGWKNGDGLGIQRQGINEPIRPKIQMSSKGLGYDPKSNPWIEHNKDFEEILKNLNQSNVKVDESIDTKNLIIDSKKLEKKSKGSRARIHYHKFVKGKDLSQATSDDLKSIFGVIEDKSKSDDETCEKQDSTNTINKGSMIQYFKTKMEKRKTGNIVENPSINYNDQSSEILPEKYTESNVRTQKKKKKRKTDIEENLTVEECDTINKEPDKSFNEENTSEIEVVKKSKKKKKRKIDAEQACIERECALVNEEDDKALTIDSAHANEGSESIKLKNKKKKKKSEEDKPELIRNKSFGNPGGDQLNPTDLMKSKPENFGINRGSMVDYFKRKMEERSSVSTSNFLKQCSKSIEETFDSRFNQNGEDSKTEIDPVSSNKTKKRKKSISQNRDEMKQASNMSSDAVLDQDAVTIEKKRKKGKSTFSL